MLLMITLIIGNETEQGLRFTEDPWARLANEEVNGIRRYRGDLDAFHRYTGNANVHRFGYNWDNLIMLIRGIAPNCRP